jgi:hypothetical protein
MKTPTIKEIITETTRTLDDELVSSDVMRLWIEAVYTAARIEDNRVRDIIIDALMNFIKDLGSHREEKYGL